MGHANTSLIDQLPILGDVSKGHRVAMHLRGLTLNCLTQFYANLWSQCWHEEFQG